MARPLMFFFCVDQLDQICEVCFLYSILIRITSRVSCGTMIALPNLMPNVALTRFRTLKEASNVVKIASVG
jgi:hypothetical protein